MKRKHTAKLFMVIQQALVVIGITFVILSLAQLGDASQNVSNQEKQTKIKKEKIKKMQTEKQSNQKKLNNLEFVPRVTSHMGALEGCLNYLGIDVSPGWLYGGTGHAFILNIDTDLCGSGPHCWGWGVVNKLGKNIGYKTKVIYTNKSKDDFSQKQEKAWDFVRKSIDDGFPCYGWHYDFMVINGYDGNGYLLSGPVDDAPGDWRKFGADAVGFLEVWSVRPGQKSDDMTTIKDALSFAVDLAKEPDKRTLDPGTGGLSGYDNWIEGLKSGEGDAFGGAYNTAIWAECRRFAVDFLEEANQRTEKKYDSLFQPAIKQYKLVSDNLNEVEKLFPYKDATEEECKQNMEDNKRRQKAVELLKSAKEAEASGLKALENILAKLKMEPKIVNRSAFNVMGVSAHGNPSSMNYGEIWNQFTPYDAQVKQFSLDKGYYNVYFATEEDNIVDLVAGMAVEDVSNVPEGLTTCEVPAMRCAVFECTMKTIGQTYEYIYRDWLPQSKYEHDAKPDFEYFSSDSETEDSPVLIHVAIKEKSPD